MLAQHRFGQVHRTSDGRGGVESNLRYWILFGLAALSLATSRAGIGPADVAMFGMAVVALVTIALRSRRNRISNQPPMSTDHLSSPLHPASAWRGGVESNLRYWILFGLAALALATSRAGIGPADVAMFGMAVGALVAIALRSRRNRISNPQPGSPAAR